MDRGGPRRLRRDSNHISATDSAAPGLDADPATHPPSTAAWRGRDAVRCIERDIDIPLATQCSYHRPNPTLPYTVIACRGVAGGNVRITAANMIE